MRYHRFARSIEQQSGAAKKSKHSAAAATAAARQKQGAAGEAKQWTNKHSESNNVHGGSQPLLFEEAVQRARHAVRHLLLLPLPLVPVLRRDALLPHPRLQHGKQWLMAIGVREDMWSVCVC